MLQINVHVCEEMVISQLLYSVYSDLFVSIRISCLFISVVVVVIIIIIIIIIICQYSVRNRRCLYIGN
jgi:hypothetical protein